MLVCAGGTNSLDFLGLNGGIACILSEVIDTGGLGDVGVDKEVILELEPFFRASTLAVEGVVVDTGDGDEVRKGSSDSSVRLTLTS